MTDPQVQAEVAHAKRAAELANVCPPGEILRRDEAETGREGYKPAGIEDRRATDPRGPTEFKPMVQAEVLRLVQGRYMSLTRAQALKRVVRRIRQLMGPDAPAPAVLKWWVAEMIANLGEDSGIVRLGAMRLLAEAIGLLRPGSGLMINSRHTPAYIPKVAFTVIPPKNRLEKASGINGLKNLEMKPAPATENKEVQK